MDQLSNKGSNPATSIANSKRVEKLKFLFSEASPFSDCAVPPNAPQKYCSIAMIKSDLFEITIDETKKYLQLLDAEVVSGPKYSEEEFYGEKNPFFAD